MTAYVKNRRTRLHKPRIVEKTELAEKLYGPLYNEIDSFLNRRRKYTKAKVINFAKIDAVYAKIELGHARKEGGYEVTASEFGLESVKKLEEVALNLVKRMNTRRGSLG